MTSADNPLADQTRDGFESAVVITSDPPTEWRPAPNRAQRRKMEREMSVFKRKQPKGIK